MLVSVIIPYTDRDSPLLPRAIASVEAQTVRDFEIVRVYDEHYEGIPWARNTGFARAKGKFILPLDCDDWIEPEYLEKTLAKMVGQVAIVSTDMRYFGENEGLIIKAEKRNYRQQLEQNKITVTSLVRALAIHQAGPWDHNLRGWEDWDMWLRILRDENWTHDVVNDTLFHYRLHKTGMNQWANDNKKMLMTYLAAKHPGFMHLRANGKRWNEI